MATENPRVAAYPPRRVYERLVKFRHEHHLKSDSAAIVAVLEAYFFGDTPSQLPSDLPNTAQRLEDLEGKSKACLWW